MNNTTIIALIVYSIGLIGWYFIWYLVVGFGLLKKMRLLHFPFWGAQFVFVVNIILAFFAVDHEYAIELQLYPYVENNAKAVASMSLAIAVFWVFVTKDKLLDKAHLPVKLFLWLLFWAFLISVVGTLPLYWVPPGDQWLTTLRHIKSVPYFYSLFILASALIVFLYELAFRKNQIHDIPVLTLGSIQNNTKE